MGAPVQKFDVVIVFRNSTRANSKIRIKVIKNKHIDDINDIKKKIVGIPDTADILNIGVGKLFKQKWKERYKL